MDLQDALRDELAGADRPTALERLVAFASHRARCPHVAAYEGKDAWRRKAAVGRRPFPDLVTALPPTARNARNVAVGGDPMRPAVFLRLEWDGQVHDPEAVEALEAACASAVLPS
ncbi:MAG TPA: hypothetical protein VEJ18_22195 [Planctomycetota bacterium]|nr:hypothetical protein [Planctomycetota bacterium]